MGLLRLKSATKICDQMYQSCAESAYHVTYTIQNIVETQKLLYCRLNDEVGVRKVSAAQEEGKFETAPAVFQAMTKNGLSKSDMCKGTCISRSKRIMRLN